MSAVGSLEVQYSPLEIRSFMDGHDVVAIQEADPLFVEALDESFRDRLIRGSDDRDGRGVQVESCSALVIHPDSGIKVVHQEQASLGFSFMQGGRRVHVCRDVVAVLAERESDGQQLVLCSAHLHPPDYVEGRGRTDYMEYLEPLQRALRSCCKASDEKAPYLVMGDFNLSPEEWAKRTRRHRFWKSFDNVVPEGGETAHRSNPCATGDFAICRGGGSWSGQSFGPAGFGAFERFAKRFTTAAHRKIHLQRAKEACQKALDECAMANAAGTGPEVGEPHHSGFILQDAKDSLQATASGIRRALRRVELTRHRKGLLTSDHRPLSFTGYLGEATPAKEVYN